MIFADLIQELDEDVTDAVDELFEAAWSNQSHPQDMLLVDQHGFYYELLADPLVRERHKVGPYVIGPGEIGFGETTLYEFINWYRQSHLLDKTEFEESLERDEEAKLHEELTIQLEHGIYLRFWEADFLLKQYYQLSSLASGEPYDWRLEVPGYSRNGSKQEFIRKEIRNRIKSICPSFYALVKQNFVSQIRNAIAHSQYYIMGRSMRFLNYSDNPKAYSSLKGLTFDEWYRMFHTTLLLHNATIGAFKRYRERYKRKTLGNGNRVEVRVAGQHNVMQAV
jgi:hypothetical protein